MSVYERDRPDYADAAIRSMVEQSAPFTDLVIVCDGPVGADLDAVIERWRGELGERLRVHRLAENRGLAGALRAGLPLCRTERVARMDADDVSRPRRCELLLDAMNCRGLDLVGGFISEFDRTPGDMASVREVPLEREDIIAFAKRRNPFNHVSVMFRRPAVLAAGGYRDVHLLEDYDLWVRMLMNGCACANIPRVVVDVRTGAGMYARRSSLRYLKEQWRFFGRLHSQGFVSRGQEAVALAARSAATLMPAGAVKRAYGLVLRRR